MLMPDSDVQDQYPDWSIFLQLDMFLWFVQDFANNSPVKEKLLHNNLLRSKIYIPLFSGETLHCQWGCHGIRLQVEILGSKSWVMIGVT